MSEKNITIKINKDLHRDIKVHIASKGITLKDYILDLINKDMNKK